MKDIPIAFIDDETLYESENYVNFKLEEKDKEIERLQHNQEVSTKWEIELTQKNTKLIEENKKLHSIIKEVRGYIEENRDRKTGRLDSRLKKVLEILDKVEENK